MEFVTIKTFDNPTIANISKSKLASYGIDCYLADEHTIGANWLFANAIGGVKLNVRSADQQKALAILEGDFESLNFETIDEDTPQEGILCMNCGSKDIKLPPTPVHPLVIILFLGIPLLFYRRKTICNSCGSSWKQPIAKTI